MSEKHTFCTPPDERGNVFEIEAPIRIEQRMVFECVEWYRAEPHHAGLSEPERDLRIWIFTMGPPGGPQVWKHLEH